MYPLSTLILSLVRCWPAHRQRREAAIHRAVESTRCRTAPRGPLLQHRGDVDNAVSIDRHNFLMPLFESGTPGRLVADQEDSNTFDVHPCD